MSIGQEGDHVALGTAQLYCGCFMHWVGGGGSGPSIKIALAVTSFTSPTVLIDGGGNPYCHYSSLKCDSGTATCTSGNWPFSLTPVPPCPDPLQVRWIRATIGGGQYCFAFGYDVPGGAPILCY